MSCDKYRGGFNNCPICSTEQEYEVCPQCKGSGIMYLTEQKGYVSKEEYDATPKDERCIDKCERCNGEGEIPIEPYEPDPDEWYERKRLGEI